MPMPVVIEEITHVGNETTSATDLEDGSLGEGYKRRKLEP